MYFLLSSSRTVMRLCGIVQWGRVFYIANCAGWCHRRALGLKINLLMEFSYGLDSGTSSRLFRCCSGCDESDGHHR